MEKNKCYTNSNTDLFIHVHNYTIDDSGNYHIKGSIFDKNTGVMIEIAKNYCMKAKAVEALTEHRLPCTFCVKNCGNDHCHTNRG